MEEGKKHIRQTPRGKYPLPNIPAEKSWANMKDMLDQEIPVKHPRSTGKGYMNKLFKFLLIPVVLTIVILLVWFPTVDKENQLPTKHSVYSPKKTEKQAPVTEAHAAKNTVPAERAYSFQAPEKIDINSRRTDAHSSASVINKEKPAPSKFTEATKAYDVTSNSRKKRQKNVVFAKSNIPEKIAKSADKKGPPVIYGMKTTGNIKNQVTKDRLPETENRFTEKDPTKTYGAGNTNHAFERERILVFILEQKRPVDSNRLKQQFQAIMINPPNPVSGSLSFQNKDKKNGSLTKNIHAGMYWNVGLPLNNYSNYFTGTNKKQQLYVSFIPGFWLSKSFGAKSEILLKFSAFNLHFTGEKELSISVTQLTDSLKSALTNSVRLLKTQSLLTGLEYNHHITNRLVLNIGSTIQFQHRALLRNVTSSSSKGITADTLAGIKRNAAEWKHLNNYFISINPGILYSRKNYQIGAGLNFPLTDITKETSFRPVNGQLLLRWKIK